MPITIDAIIANSGQTDRQTPERNTPLNANGLEYAYDIGESAFQLIYDRVFLVTSDFLCAQQSGGQILRGAGMDLRKLENFSHRTESSIGLGTLDWNPPGAQPEDLNAWTDLLMRHYALKREGEPDFHYPILSQQVAALSSALADGAEFLFRSLHPDEAGALVIVSHAPLVDALAHYLTGTWRFRKTRQYSSNGMPMFRVELPQRIIAHPDDYLGLRIVAPTPVSGALSFAFQGRVRMEESTMLRRKAQELTRYAYHAAQPATRVVTVNASSG